MEGRSVPRWEQEQNNSIFVNIAETNYNTNKNPTSSTKHGVSASSVPN